MVYKCHVCQKNFDGDLMVFRNHIEDHIVDVVKTDFPHWVEKDGMCRKCLEYYQGQIKGKAVSGFDSKKISWWSKFKSKIFS